MMLYFRPYTSGDIFECLNVGFAKKYKYNIKESMIDTDRTWTLYENDKVLGCAGFRLYWEGVYEVWLHPKTPEILKKHLLLVIRKIKKEIDKLDYYRLHAPIHTETKNYDKLMMILGFQREGILRRYGPDGKDFIMYGRIK